MGGHKDSDHENREQGEGPDGHHEQDNGNVVIKNGEINGKKITGGHDGRMDFTEENGVMTLNGKPYDSY